MSSTNKVLQMQDPDAMSHINLLMRQRFDLPADEPGPDRICMHWPLNGAPKIQALSRSLAVLAGHWAGAHADAKSWNHLLPRCIDVEQAGPQAESDVLRLRATAMCAEIQRIKLLTRSLVEDFQKIGEWLARAAGSTWDAGKTVRRALSLASTLGESHRVIAKDWLAADMNSLVAWLLRQALKLLDRIEMTAEAIVADLVDTRVYGDILQSAAEILDHAAAIANESELFVQDFDRRWRSFRDQIATVVALSKDALGAREGSEGS